MTEPLNRVLVTGASGFVGRALVGRLAAPVAALRFGAADWKAQLDAAPLEGATIFHLAGLAHLPGGGDAEFVAANVTKTEALAQAAVRAGARRLVFVSSIKVYGEESPERPFHVDDPAAPEDAYARSKVAAEQALARIAEHGLETVIVRPPLVYGPGASGNLAALLRLADSPWPLPFASLDAPRSFVHVDDLARLLVACGVQPGARGRTYIAAHPDTVSAARLVTLARRAMGRPPRLLPAPRVLLEAAASALGHGSSIRRLSRSLAGDPSAGQRELGWIARVSIEQAVEEMVRDYRAQVRP